MQEIMSMKLKKLAAAGIVVVFGMSCLYFIKSNIKIAHTKNDNAFRQMEFIASYIELYKKENGEYPSEREGLNVLIEPSRHCPYFKNPDVLLDPWKRRFVYKRIESASNSHYVMYSVGANGRDEGGEGDDIKFPRDQ